jgi:hypothetical protein
MNPRTRKALWILFGILLVASLFLAGPAHGVLHHDTDELGSCDLCHFASVEAPRFESVVAWLALQQVEPSGAIELVRDQLLPEQGNARAPPAAG